jgi:FHA domain
MAAVLARWRATYTPGDWVVLSGPTSLVLLEPPTHEWAALINTLWEEVVASSSIVDLADRLASFKIDALPSFGAFFWTADGMRSLIRGQISVLDLATGKVVANGEGMQTWSEVGLAGVSHIRVDTPYEGDATLLELPLVVGAVRASSVTLDASEDALLDSPQSESVPEFAPTPLSEVATAPPAEGDQQPEAVAGVAAAAATPIEQTAELSAEEIAALQNADTQLLPSSFDGPASDAQAEVAPPAQPVPSAAQEAVSDAAPEPVGAAEPTSESSFDESVQDSAILAVLCQHGHANPPNSIDCRVCSTPVARKVPQFVAGPVLAVLRATDGSSVQMDRPVLIGRAPSGDRSNSRSPRLMTLPSPNHDISRTHLEVAPDDWQIVVTDLNSTNGTVLVRPGAVDRQQLAPGEPVHVQLGSVLELGDGVSVLIDFPQ